MLTKRNCFAYQRRILIFPINFFTSTSTGPLGTQSSNGENSITSNVKLIQYVRSSYGGEGVFHPVDGILHAHPQTAAQCEENSAEHNNAEK